MFHVGLIPTVRFPVERIMNHARFAVLITSLFAGPVALAQQNPPDATDPAAAASDPPVYAPYVEKATERWETEIRRLEALDESESYAEDAVLFIGSSSVRLWNDIAADIAPYKPINRGYGGSRFSDVAVFAERLIRPHRFQAMVMFVANDVTGGDDDRTPEEVAALASSILQVARETQPEAQLFIVEITPSARRFAAWPEIRRVNVALRELCLTESNTTFIPTAEYYLDANNQPRTELFRQDRLHLNDDGYALWAKLIKRRLDDVLQEKVLAVRR